MIRGPAEVDTKGGSGPLTGSRGPHFCGEDSRGSDQLLGHLASLEPAGQEGAGHEEVLSPSQLGWKYEPAHKSLRSRSKTLSQGDQESGMSCEWTMRQRGNRARGRTQAVSWVWQVVVKPTALRKSHWKEATVKGQLC